MSLSFHDTLGRWWPSGLVIITVLYLTCWPDPLPSEAIPLFPGADKLVHAIMFGGVVGALDFDYFRTHRDLPYSIRLIILCSAGALGVVTELIQAMEIIGRSCDFYDFCADMTGGVIAFFAAPPVILALFKNSKSNK